VEKGLERIEKSHRIEREVEKEKGRKVADEEMTR